MKQKDYLPIIVVFFPLLLMLIWLATLYITMMLGTDIRLKITGYDPRDLLSGHYLRYRVDYGLPVAALCGDQDLGRNSYTLNSSSVLATSSSFRCICFKPPNAKEENKAFWAGECNERPNECDLYLEGRCEYGRFSAGIEKYYFPEKFKEVLRTLPERASLIVRIFRGKGIVRGIEIQGNDIEKYVEQQDKK